MNLDIPEIRLLAESFVQEMWIISRGRLPKGVTRLKMLKVEE